MNIEYVVAGLQFLPYMEEILGRHCWVVVYMCMCTSTAQLLVVCGSMVTMCQVHIYILGTIRLYYFMCVCTTAGVLYRVMY